MPNLKKIILVSTLVAATALLANPAGKAVKNGAKDSAKSAVVKDDDKGVVEKKKNKMERKVKTKAVKAAL